jgi:PadR family transcriptional regulator, regulatory protein PadR
MNQPRITGQVMRVLYVFSESGHVELTGADIHDRTGMLSGTLYPILIRLREAGWLSDRWEDGKPAELGRPNRRYYRLTASGARAYKSALPKATSGAIAWAQ